MKFTDEDIAFMDSLNNTGVIECNIYTTAQHGHIRGLDRNLKIKLEQIYQRVFSQPKFSLCYHCGNDVMNLVLKLYGELDKHKALTASIQTMVEETVSEKPKNEKKK